jgi:aryl-alcohol dehydrogenase-like predicted oxidoreductase
MLKRKLGNSETIISAVGIGSMSFTNFYGKTDEVASHKILSKALDLEINHIDTSNVYGMGQSEKVIGNYLAKQGKQKQSLFKIATKASVSKNPQTGRREFNNSESHLRTELDNSLKRLGLEYVDLFYIHRRDNRIEIEKVVETLKKFVNEGKIKNFGFSEIAPSSLEKAEKICHVGAVQNEYSLGVRSPELGLLQATKKNKTILVAFSPLGRGLLTDKPPSISKAQSLDFLKVNPRFQKTNLEYNTNVTNNFRDYASDLNTSAASLAIAWILEQGNNIIAIPGTRSIEHLIEHAEGGSLKLTNNQLREIENILPVGWCHGDRYSTDQWYGPERFC